MSETLMGFSRPSLTFHISEKKREERPLMLAFPHFQHV